VSRPLPNHIPASWLRSNEHRFATAAFIPENARLPIIEPREPVPEFLDPEIRVVIPGLDIDVAGFVLRTAPAYHLAVPYLYDLNRPIRIQAKLRCYANVILVGPRVGFLVVVNNKQTGRRQRYSTVFVPFPYFRPNHHLRFRYPAE
jgi:hypothetical protein